MVVYLGNLNKNTLFAHPQPTLLSPSHSPCCCSRCATLLKLFANILMKNCVITKVTKVIQEDPQRPLFIQERLGRSWPSLEFLPTPMQTIPSVVINKGSPTSLVLLNDLTPPGKTFVLHPDLLPSSNPSFFYQSEQERLGDPCRFYVLSSRRFTALVCVRVVLWQGVKVQSITLWKIINRYSSALLYF